MAFFERYCIDEAALHIEKYNDYYVFSESVEVCSRILALFGIDEKRGHIINGHVPVKIKNGESPVKADGRLFVIDGGISKAYQKATGIAGYTLIYNSYGLRLVSHEPFESKEMAIVRESDIHSDTVLVEQVPRRRSVADTDIGKEIEESIIDLTNLLSAYRDGTIREKDV